MQAFVTILDMNPYTCTRKTILKRARTTQVIAGLCSTINSKPWQCPWYSVYLIHTCTTALPCIAHVRFIMWVRSNSSCRCREHDVSGASQIGSQQLLALSCWISSFLVCATAHPTYWASRNVANNKKQKKTKTKRRQSNV